MKTSLVAFSAIILVIAACQAPAEKQYLIDGPEVELGKQMLSNYLNQNWDAYPSMFADTAKIYRNKSWMNPDNGMNVDEYVADLKVGLENVSSYSFESPILECIINEEGEHWVHMWGVWTGHNDLTNKDYEIPVHVSMLVIDGKIHAQGEMFNTAEIATDMLTLQMIAAQEENEGEEGTD